MRCLVDEGELTVAVAQKAYFTAADGIIKDDKYDDEAIQRHWDDAFGCGSPPLKRNTVDC
jgi:hypothetical protein